MRQYFLPVRVPTLEADTVLVDGIAVDPAAIPRLSSPQTCLAGSVQQILDPEAFQPGGAYEGWEGYDNIWLDKSGNIQGYTREGTSYLLLPLSAPELSAKKSASTVKT